MNPSCLAFIVSLHEMVYLMEFYFLAFGSDTIYSELSTVRECIDFRKKKI
jgi:hypothetical protein